MRMRPATLTMPLGSRRAVERALDALTAYNRAWLADLRGVSGRTPRLLSSGVRYQREQGREQWWPIPRVLATGYGDCEDLASWLAAETGGDAIALRVPTGYHIVTRLPTGQIVDPSRMLGMGR
jgi:hypothetical protein